MKIRARLVVGCLLLAGAAGAVEWKNVDADHYCGGRKASSGYLQGKVVLVDRWGVGCPPCRALLPRVESIWKSFKTKPCVVLGGHCEGWGTAEGIKKLVDQNALTYPMYEGAGLAANEPKFDAIPFLYVVDETGRIVYSGHGEREATEALVTALTDMESPRSIEQWKRFLDYELDNLPGRAYLRLKEFNKKHPSEAKAFLPKAKAMFALPKIKDLADLVAIAKEYKDYVAKTPIEKKQFPSKVKAAIRKYTPLVKALEDPRMVQEAKNSIADLKWTLADL